MIAVVFGLLAAVANEAWIRLFRSHGSDFTDSSAFFAAAANTLRRSPEPRPRRTIDTARITAAKLIASGKK